MAKLYFTYNCNLQSFSIQCSHSWEADSLSVYIMPAFCRIWKVTSAFTRTRTTKSINGMKMKSAILQFVGLCTARHFERHYCFRPQGSPRSFFTVIYLGYLWKTTEFSQQFYANLQDIIPQNFWNFISIAVKISNLKYKRVTYVTFSVTVLGSLGQSISLVNARRKIDDYANTPPDNEKEITPRNLAIYCMGFFRCVLSVKKAK